MKKFSGNHRRMSLDSANPSCYHPDITKIEQVHEIMKKNGDGRGLYFIRNSFSEPGRLVVSVRHINGLVHIKIDRRNNKYLIGSSQFDDLPCLLHHFTRNPIINEEGLTDVILKTPIYQDSFRNGCRDDSSLATRTSYSDSSAEGDKRQARLKHCLTISEEFPSSNNNFPKLLCEDNYAMGIDREYITPSISLRPLPELPPRKPLGQPRTPPINHSGLQQEISVEYTDLCMDLTGGWKILPVPGKNVEFISPTGRSEVNLPAEIWVSLTPDQHLAVRRWMAAGDVTNGVNNEYMDMTKTAVKSAFNY